MFPRRGVCGETGLGPQCMSVGRHARVHLCVYWGGGVAGHFLRSLFSVSLVQFFQVILQHPTGPSPLPRPPAGNMIVKESLDHVTVLGLHPQLIMSAAAWGPPLAAHMSREPWKEGHLTALFCATTASWTQNGPLPPKSGPRSLPRTPCSAPPLSRNFPWLLHH